MMRITNAMMTSNTKNNININKLNEDRLNTQISTGQVISRPSEDPVVAIRALRLNTNLSQLTQYYKKNIPDAQAWMNVTETALKQTNDIFTNIKENLTAGASDNHTASDRQKILESLKGLRAELYSSGNADYAERTVFTGYRTGESLTFLSTDTDLNGKYNISETFDKKAVEKITYIKTTPSDIETNVENKDVYRIRLSYDNNDTTPDPVPDKIKLPNGKDIKVSLKSITGQDQSTIDGYYTNVPDKEAYYIPETGELILGKGAKEDYENSFKAVTLDKITIGGRTLKVTQGSDPRDDEITFDPITGQIALGKKINEEISKMDPATTKIKLPDGTEYDLGSGDYKVAYDSTSGVMTLGSKVRYDEDTSTTPATLIPRFKSGEKAEFAYDKSQWKSGDLRPEHYFACIQTVTGKDPVYYNYEQKQDGSVNTSRPNFKNQNIEVEISFNQKITINTHANEVYTHDIGRDVDELLTITQAVVDSDEKVKALEKEYAEASESAKPAIQKKLDAANKEYSLKKDKMQKMFSAALDTFAGYADRNDVAIANIGSMQSRLSITKERVADQLQSFKELADANINAELTESSIDFASAKLALEAAQLAAGKIAQQTLLNYL